MVITDLPDVPPPPASEDPDASPAPPAAAAARGGRRTLTVGAIRVAYGLFAAVGATVALVALATYQLISAPPPPPT